MRLTVIAGYMAATIMAHSPGRYVYTEKNRAYRLTIDVHSNRSIAITFESPTTYFIDGNYPYRWQGGRTYAIDFNVTPDAVPRWRSQIQSADPDLNLQDGDLTTLTYLSGDHFSVKFGGKTLKLFRQAFSLQPGEFVYTEDDFPSPFHYISYIVHADGGLDVQFLCYDALTTVSFNLTESKRSVRHKTYVLSPIGNVAKLKANVRVICQGSFKPRDLTYVVFADPSTIFIPIHGTRYQLNKV